MVSVSHVPVACFLLCIFLTNCPSSLSHFFFVFGGGHCVFPYQMLVEMACYLPTAVVAEKLGGTPQSWDMDDAQIVLQSLDTDGNGTVERDEFIDWTTKGMSKFKNDPGSMDAIFDSGPIGQKMACFVWALNSYLGEDD